MATITRDASSRSARAALSLAGLLLVATAALFAASWVDPGYDVTCGSVLRPSVWATDVAPARARR